MVLAVPLGWGWGFQGPSLGLKPRAACAVRSPMPKRDWAQRAWDGVQRFIANSEGVEYVPPGGAKPKGSAEARARGAKGGAARSAKLTAEQKAEIGRKGAAKRWGKTGA